MEHSVITISGSGKVHKVSITPDTSSDEETLIQSVVDELMQMPHCAWIALIESQYTVTRELLIPKADLRKLCADILDRTDRRGFFGHELDLNFRFVDCDEDFDFSDLTDLGELDEVLADLPENIIDGIDAVKLTIKGSDTMFDLLECKWVNIGLRAEIAQAFIQRFK